MSESSDTNNEDSSIEVSLAKLVTLKSQIDSRYQQRNEIAVIENLQQARKAHQDSKKTSLKSDVKKTSMFVNKLRSMNSEALTQCIRDVETLNLTLYISEIVNAILEISFKPNDVPYIVKLSTSLHKRYEDFSHLLLDKLKQSLLAPISNASNDDKDKDSNIQKKKRIQIRLIIELFEAGVFLDESFFVVLIKQLIGKTKTNENTANVKRQVDLMGISTFVKYGSETILGIHNKTARTLARNAGRELSDMPIFLIVKESISKEINDYIQEIYNHICTELTNSHKIFKKKEKRAENDKLIHGSLSENKQIELENARKLFERLLGVVSGLSESLCEDMPVLEEERDEDEMSGGSDASRSAGITVWDNSSNSSSSDYNGPFGDLESRSFYEDLPDLLTMIPISLLGITAEQQAALSEQFKISKENKYSGPPPNILPTSLPSTPNTTSIEDAVDVNVADAVVDDKVEVERYDDDKDEDDVTNSPSTEETPHTRVLLLIQDKLPDCTSKAKCDEFCVSFCFLNSKSARRKLAQAMLKIPWGRGELVSMYARIIASLHRIFNDIAPVVLESIQKELTFMMKSKALLSYNQVESKCRTLRYLGELIKFSVAPPIMALKSFKSFLGDFTSHNVDYMSTLIESCGRFLYMLPYTRERMEGLIDTMLRLRRSRYLDLRQQTLIDSAYFAVKPPEKRLTKKKELSLLHRYVRFLLIDRLCCNSHSTASLSSTSLVDSIIISIRRLPWGKAKKTATLDKEPANDQPVDSDTIDKTDEADDNKPVEEIAVETPEQLEGYIIKYCLRIARQKYASINILADFLAGILRYKPNIVIKCIDILLEEIYRGFDSPFKRDHQRLIGYVRLLGELYNYAVLTSSFVLETLYFFIQYGHEKPLGIEKLSGTGQPGTASSGGITSYTSGIYSHIISTTSIITPSLTESSQSVQSRNEMTLDQLVYKLTTIKYDPSRYDVKYSYTNNSSDCIDPSYDLFRAQLVVELIQTCGEYFVKGHLKNRMNTFLMYFQRYLMYKGNNIAVHVEFAILDMFDMLEQHAKEAGTVPTETENGVSGGTVFTRYSSLEQVELLIQSIEGNASTLNQEEGDEDEDDGGDDDMRSDMNKKRNENDDEHEGNKDDDQAPYNQDVDEEDDSISQLELAKLMEKTRLAEQEDEEFEKTFRSVMMDSIASASKIYNTKSDIDRMAMPAVLPKPKNILKPSALNPNTSITGSGSAPGVVFKVLARDTKGRVETRQVMLPEDNSMVVKLQKSEELIRLEKQKMKEKVLMLESLQERQEQESQLFRGNILTNFTEDGGVDVDVALPGSINPYTRPTSQPVSVNQHKGGVYRKPGEEVNPVYQGGKKVMDSLNLDEFLREADKAEVRRLQQYQQNRR